VAGSSPQVNQLLQEMLARGSANAAQQAELAAHHHHHQITKLSHSINAIGSACGQHACLCTGGGCCNGRA
jgi:hypothetical protein